jgi:hypothetical protein
MPTTFRTQRARFLLRDQCAGLDDFPRSGSWQALHDRGTWATGLSCIDAGVPGRAHGLRKAGATIAAENGATVRQLMAIFGWKTLVRAELYTEGPPAEVTSKIGRGQKRGCKTSFR